MIFAQLCLHRYLKVKVGVEQVKLGTIGKLMKWSKQ